MIQIKYKKQGVHYLEVIRDVLVLGIVHYCNKECIFDATCNDCPHKTACSDIYRAIGHIDRLIAEENKK